MKIVRESDRRPAPSNCNQVVDLLVPYEAAYGMSDMEPIIEIMQTNWLRSWGENYPQQRNEIIIIIIIAGRI